MSKEYEFIKECGVFFVSTIKGTKPATRPFGAIMEKKIDYNDIIHRIGYFRTKANLSARETSLRLGYSEQFMKRIENKSVELKVSTLLDFFDIVDITPQDFFFMGDHYNK